MGLFADDDLQDERLKLLERHIRILTETVQQNQADIVACLVTQLVLQAQIEQKVAAADVDPAISSLNDQVAEARVRLAKASDEASESWAGVQADLRGMMDGLRSKVQEAAKQRESS